MGSSATKLTTVNDFSVQDFVNDVKAQSEDPTFLSELKITPKEKANLLLNTSALNGVNIYRSLDPQMIGPFKCVTIPKGTWLYKSSSELELPEQMKIQFGGSWYGSLEVAKQYVELHEKVPELKNIYLIATKVQKPMNLMLLNHRTNIKAILEKEQSSSKRKSIEDATGVNTSIFRQMFNELNDKGLLSLFFTTTKAVIFPSRHSTMAEDSEMMKSFCKIWKEEKLDIHGYIATYLESSFGAMHEEVSICLQDVSEYLSPPKTISLETAKTLIKEHSLFSSTFYTSVKRHLKKNYKTLLFFTGIIAAYKLYQTKNLAAFKRIIDKKWSLLQTQCKSEEFKMNQNEFIQTVLLVTAYTCKASLFMENNQIKSQKDICKELNYNLKDNIFRTASFDILSTLLLGNVVTHAISFLIPWDGRSTSIHKANLKTKKLEEQLPDLNHPSIYNNMVLNFYFGENWKSVIESKTIDEIRNEIMMKNPSTFALVFFNQEGELRPKKEVLQVLAVLG